MFIETKGEGEEETKKETAKPKQFIPRAVGQKSRPSIGCPGFTPASGRQTPTLPPG